MSTRHVAILIDGGFFLRRLPAIVGKSKCVTPEEVILWINRMCKGHIKNLTGDDKRWRDHIYRIFYYDARPYDGKSHHPMLNRSIDFSKSDTARFRLELFDALKKQRKVALRLGKVTREGDWTLPNQRMKKLFATQSWFAALSITDANEPLILTPEQHEAAVRMKNIWMVIQANEVFLPLKQKGVDMRIGLDIASIALKKQADTVVLVAGDSDFVPAAKLARREGMEIILDPLWQQVHDDLFEHIDGLYSGLRKNKSGPFEPEATMESGPGEL